MTEPTQLPAHITRTLPDCGHCHETHVDLSFWRTRRSDKYIALCPTTGHEIFMRVYATPEAADAH